jgi:NADPH:quinone reductase-like Zn-dependent oxidoreductase
MTFLARLNKEDLAILGDLMREGKMTPVIDKTYKLNDVPAALTYLETGHARGKVIITVE